MDKVKRFDLQNNEYNYPYHQIPYIKNHSVINFRSLGWGHKYYCYLLTVKDIIDKLNSKSLLDIGCGEGKFLSLFYGQIQNLVGVDLSEKAISFARAFNPGINFHIKHSSDLEENFDVITAIEVLEHIPDNELNDFFSSVYHRLNKNGSFIICVPTIVRKVSPKHYRHYDLELLQSHIRNSGVGFSISEVKYVYKRTLLLRFYEKAFRNKFWFIEVHFLNRLFWKYTWNTLRFATKKNGEQLIVRMTKD